MPGVAFNPVTQTVVQPATYAQIGFVWNTKLPHELSLCSLWYPGHCSPLVTSKHAVV